MNTPIADFVRRYAASDAVRFHMPGHKGRPFLGCEPWDITEIAGADALYEAEGIIAESEKNAGALFGSRRTCYATEGASQCIRAMLYLAVTAGKSRTVVAARNIHRAFISAAALLDLEVVWLWPEESRSLCGCPISEKNLEQTLSDLPEPPAAVYLTSPDYLGGMADLSALAPICHRHGVPLLVDNAHGAYLRFLPGGSRHPIDLGAAACCDSGHKTLPVLTGGAYLHLGPKAPVQEESTVRNALALFGSTSPSYLILQSLDACNRLLSTDYPARLQECCDRLAALRARLNALAAAQGTALPLALDGPAREPMKLTLDAAALGLTGQALADHLRQNGMECEYADPRYLVLMFTPENPAEDMARLEAALAELCARGIPPAESPAEHREAFCALARQAEPRLTVRQAVFAPQETIPAGSALGRVCALPTVSCPPAIPIVVSGEVIGPAALELFAAYGVETVSVVKPEKF